MSKKGKKKQKDEEEKEDLDKVVYITKLEHSFGFETSKANNVHFLDSDHVITAAGNTVQIINIHNAGIEIISGLDGGGVGAVCVHPQKKFFVVCEKGKGPNVYVYRYPEKTIAYTLRGGTSFEYTCCAFNQAGDKLATVGSEPDFTLTVWDYQNEHIILRSKAFGTRVFCVSFAAADDGQLTSCGAGHIKFWKMASTFTGLKLQGSIGKFGKIEISDISGYVEFPDGKVLSGTEWGSLLMWEGNLVKTEIRRLGGEPCHDGVVDVVELEGSAMSKCVLTAGHDGYIRWWPFEAMDAADTFESQPVCLIQPSFEYLVGNGVRIRSLTKGSDCWIAHDVAGAFWKVPLISWKDIQEGKAEAIVRTKKPSPLMRFHSGPIRCLDTSPFDYMAVTGGEDGTVRLFDFEKRTEVYKRQFSCPVTYLRYLPVFLDPQCLSLCVGFANGTVRILKRCTDGFVTTMLLKPHVKAIVGASYSTARPAYKGRRIFATVSSDETIFFFSCGNAASDYAPIGFTKLNGAPRDILWNSKQDMFVVGMGDGRVLLLDVPAYDSVNREVSFEFQATFRHFVYNQKMKPKDDPKATKAPIVMHDREDREDDEKEGEEGDKEGDDEDDPMKQGDKAEETGPLPVNFICVPETVQEMPSEEAQIHLNSKLIIGLHRRESIFEYMGDSWSSPDYDVFAEDPQNNLCFVDCLAVAGRYSKGGKFLLFACEEGKVLLRLTKERIKCYHSSLVHDGLAGGVVLQAQTSFDDKFLLTVGNDSCFFVQSIQAGEVPSPEKNDFAKHVRPISAAEKVAKDEDPKYSIEEAKIKADADRKRELAEQKKLTLKERTVQILNEFETIQSEIATLPPYAQLSKEDLELDKGAVELLENVNRQRLENVRKELLWDTTKKEMKLEKVRNLFISPQQVERILLYGFKNGRCVSSFRTAKLTDKQREFIDSVHELIQSEEEKRKNQSMNVQDNDSMSIDMTSGTDRQPDFERTDKSGKAASEGMNDTMNKSQSKKSKKEKSVTKSALDKAEERKREREERERGLAELKERMMNENQEDTKDTAAILKAQKYMGDYKLKNDPDYVVPENQRVTSERKQRQIILLEESMNTLRMDFNDRFLALRDLKVRLISTIMKDNKRIEEINKLLAITEKLFQPGMKFEEQPDTRNNVDKETLKKYEKDRQKAAKKAAALERAKQQFGADLMHNVDDDEDSETDEAKHDPNEEKDPHAKGKTGGKEDRRDRGTIADKMEGKIGGRSRARRESFHLTGKPKLEAERKDRLDKITKSEVENEEDMLKREVLLYEKGRLQRKINKTIATFDEALDELRREKFKLEGDLKMADIKLLLLHRELLLLRDFKKRDQQLAKRYDDRKLERQEIQQKIYQCQQKLTVKKVEIDSLLVKEKQIMAEFHAAIQGSAEVSALQKIFKKKIKRRKREETASNGSRSSDSDDSDISEDDNDDAGEDDDEEEVCPPGVALDTYKKVLELRERRLEQEDVVNDFQKSIDVLKKENEQLTKKEKTIETQLKQVEKEIQEFQNEKQKKLNELETVVVLKLKQIQCLVDDKLPEDISNLVVFTNNGMKDLHARILELYKHKKDLNKYFQDLKRQKGALEKARKDKQGNVSAWENKVYEIQLLKFGQQVNLELLENVSVDRKTEELKEVLREEEQRGEAELKKWDNAFEETKMSQLKTINENTKLLSTLGTLRHDQRKLEQVLDQSQNKILVRMTGGSKVSSAADRRHLKELIILQQQEVDQLKREIAMLRTKGGHVYTPVVHKVTS